MSTLSSAGCFRVNTETENN